MENNTFGAWLRQNRHQRGLTRLELAKQLSISETWIARLEQNKREPSPKLKFRIEKFFEAKSSHQVGDILVIQGYAFRIKSLTVHATEPAAVELVPIIEELEI